MPSSAISRGGLGIATIAACGGFAAICGSSVATAATFSKVAYPEMRAYGYPQSFATGVIAAGGTLGIMIPPSTVLAVYGLITEQDVGKLFIAGRSAGPARRRHVHDHHHADRHGAAGLPAGRPAPFLEGAARGAARHLGDAAAVRLRDRRPLWRPVHRHRSRGRGRRRRLHHRRAARPAVVGGHLPLAARDHAHRPPRSSPC